MSEQKRDNETPITRAWRVGGPMTPAQRKEAKALFIESLSNDPTITLACEYACIGRTTAYRWRESDTKFADAWEQAVERTKDVARNSIYQRGIVGWHEPVVSQGQVVYEMEPVLDQDGEQAYEHGRPKMKRGAMVTIRKWSDSLASLYARANLPEYKDKPQVNINAQLADLAEQAKNELLADLEAAIANESKTPPHQS